MKLLVGDMRFASDNLMFETKEEAEEFVKEVVGITGLEDISIQETIIPGESCGFISIRTLREAQTSINSSWNTPRIWSDRLEKFENVRTIDMEISRVID